LPRLMTW